MTERVVPYGCRIVQHTKYESSSPANNSWYTVEIYEPVFQWRFWREPKYTWVPLTREIDFHGGMTYQEVRRFSTWDLANRCREDILSAKDPDRVETKDVTHAPTT